MIYISTSSIYRDSVKDCVKELAALGIRNIELSGGAGYSEGILESLKDLKEKYSLNYLIHNYFPPPKEGFVLNIASRDEEIRGRSLALIRSSIDFAGELGIAFYSIHAGYAGHFLPPVGDGYFRQGGDRVISPEEAMATVYETIAEIRAYASEHGIKIGLENLFPFGDHPENSLLSTPEDIFSFLDSIAGDDDMGFLLDLGHLYIAAKYFNFDIDSFIGRLKERYGHKILEVHLSDNDVKVDRHAPLSPGSWQLGTALKFDLDNVPLTIECRGLNPAEVLEQYNIVKNTLERKVANGS